MADETKKAKPLTGQVLRPLRDDGHLPIEQPLNGIPLLNRMRYRAVRKELEEYLAVLQTRNAILREIEETAHIAERYNGDLVRMERIDDLRTIEGLKIDAELETALEGALDARRRATTNAILHRATIAELESRAIEAENRLAGVKNPPPAAPDPPPKMSASERMQAEIARLRRQEAELIAALLGEVGREEELSPDDQELIRDVRLATRNQISNLLDELSR